MNLDELNTIEIIKQINDGDKQIACVVEKHSDNISKAVALIVREIENEAVQLLGNSKGNVWKTLKLWRGDKIENNN